MLSHVWLSAAPGTVAFQAPPPMEFSRQEYWRGLPCSTSWDLPNPGIKPTSLCTSCICRQILHHLHHLGSPNVKVILHTTIFNLGCGRHEKSNTCIQPVFWSTERYCVRKYNVKYNIVLEIWKYLLRLIKPLLKKTKWNLDPPDLIHNLMVSSK